LNPILDWYGSKKASNVSSRRTSRENSPAKTVRFNVPEPLGSTHTNAELLLQLQQAENDKAALAEQASLAQSSRNVQAQIALEATQARESLAAQLAGEQVAHRRVRDRVEQLELQIKLEKQNNELLQDERRRERSFANLEDPWLTTAREKLEQLGYGEAPRGFGWIPLSPSQSPPAEAQPSAAEESLAANLIQQRQ